MTASPVINDKDCIITCVNCGHVNTYGRWMTGPKGTRGSAECPVCRSGAYKLWVDTSAFNDGIGRILRKLIEAELKERCDE